MYAQEATVEHFGSDNAPSDLTTRSPLRRAGWVIAGTISLGLGIIGALLPVMPTTVFILIAAGCYARGSQRLSQRLESHRVFGPMIRDWRQHRAISTRARRIAITMIVVSLTASAIAVDIDLVRVALVIVGIALVTFLARLPARETLSAPVMAP